MLPMAQRTPLQNISSNLLNRKEYTSSERFEGIKDHAFPLFSNTFGNYTNTDKFELNKTPAAIKKFQEFEDVSFGFKALLILKTTATKRFRGFSGDNS